MKLIRKFQSNTLYSSAGFFMGSENDFISHIYKEYDIRITEPAKDGICLRLDNAAKNLNDIWIFIPDSHDTLSAILALLSHECVHAAWFMLSADNVEISEELVAIVQQRLFVEFCNEILKYKGIE